MKFQLILKITLVIISLCSIHSQIESIAPGSKVKIKGKHEELRALHKEASMLRRDGKHDEAKEKMEEIHKLSSEQHRRERKLNEDNSYIHDFEDDHHFDGARSDNSRESHHERHIENINKNINRFIDEINAKSDILGDVKTADLLAKSDELKRLELQAANNRMQTAIDMKNLKSTDLSNEARRRKLNDMKSERELLRKQDALNREKIMELRGHIHLMLHPHSEF